MVMLKTKSALSYFGSDSEVAESLAAMLDHCKHVTIPFVGGVSILPHLKARAIVANDKNDLAINFYRVMSNTELTRDRLIAMCESTLSHPSEITEAASILATPNVAALPKAWAYWAQCWIGRKGKGGTDSPATMPSVRRTASGGTNASRIRAAASDLHQWAKQFERCEWESVCFRDLLPKVADNRECGVYCDPPWVGTGDAYLHTFSEQDHIDLAYCLSRFEASTVVVRYGDHPLIRQYYGEMGWHIVEAESRDQCNVVKGEVWITNQRGN
jgi:site-specific DNA-adenine methylase